MANFSIQHEVPNPREQKVGQWCLYFQFGTYHYDDGSTDNGYRFIWRKPDGSLQAARGQARLPNKQAIFELFALASSENWF